MSYLSILDENLLGLAYLQARIPTDATKISKLGELYETEPVGHHLELRACKSGQSHQIPLENWSIAYWDSRGCFLSSPGEKACQSVERACFVFWNDNCWPQIKWLQTCQLWVRSIEELIFSFASCVIRRAFFWTSKHGSCLHMSDSTLFQFIYFWRNTYVVRTHANSTAESWEIVRDSIGERAELQLLRVRQSRCAGSPPYNV